MNKTIKVLVVDDDPRNVRILEELLSEDFIVDAAYDGNSALDKVFTFRPDIILLDVMMPDLSGLEVSRKIREDDKCRTIKIILVSGKAILAERLEGYEAGADDYITKPFDHQELLAKVNVYAKLHAIEEVDRLKTDFLSLMTHETGTPLNAIVGFSSILLSESTLSAEHKNIVREIFTAGNNLLEKVDRILLWSALKKDQLQATNELLASDLIDAALAEITEIFAAKAITVDKQIGADTRLVGNSVLLVKALKYLLENAFKFSPESGSIIVQQSLSDEGDNCLIKIKDNGVGISDVFPDLLFTGFSTSDLDHHGVGLGISLALTKLIAEMHGGNVSATNNDTHGATFTLSLPVGATQ